MTGSSRYFLELSYKGTHYHGWQTQPNAVTVQEIVDKALSVLLRQPIATVGCGRTDTGVHARQFFAHFDGVLTKAESGDDLVLNRLNALLPDDIAVHQLHPVHPDAHARFDAMSRTYQYTIHFTKDPFKTGRSCLLKTVPSISLMNEATVLLKNYHDFSCFSKSNTQVFTNNCMIFEANWSDHGDHLVFTISADRFLRNMVRAIVGTLLDIGYGKIPVQQMDHIIGSKDRSAAGTSVPACGLHLTAVRYPYLNHPTRNG